jgi:hypothetical protein
MRAISCPPSSSCRSTFRVGVAPSEREQLRIWEVDLASVRKGRPEVDRRVPELVDRSLRRNKAVPQI